MRQPPYRFMLDLFVRQCWMLIPDTSTRHLFREPPHIVTNGNSLGRGLPTVNLNHPRVHYFDLTIIQTHALDCNTSRTAGPCSHPFFAGAALATTQEDYGHGWHGRGEYTSNTDNPLWCMVFRTAYPEHWVKVERAGQIVHLIAKRLIDLSYMLSNLQHHSRDFH